MLATFVTCALSRSNCSSSEDEVRPCTPCSDLLRLRLPEVRIDTATSVAANRGVIESFCRVVGVIGTEIGFELLLPDQWNQRFVMGGGGGFVGYIMNRARNSVYDGYATVGTDTGHRGTDASWALNSIERQLNFGHMAIHRTALTSKSIISHYYGADPRYSYFIGLSRGGGQGMMEAQRYPGDFDGIVAGAPAFNWTGMAAEFLDNLRVVYPNGAQTPVITRANLELLNRMILDRCDGLDGVRDGILNDPRDCDFDLDLVPICSNGVSDSNCLTESQRAAFQRIYEGVEGKGWRKHLGFPFGGEAERTGWYPSIVGPNNGSAPYPTWQAFYGMEVFRYFIFNDPAWDYSSYDVSRLVDDTRFASAFLDAVSIDYSAFKERGGKMIIYQGWVDPLISSLDIIDHYEEAKERDPVLSDYIRLFMLPGVTHTGGNGPGRSDWFTHIRDWVERGVAPERVVVSRSDDSGTMTRPVFPYPRKAVYDGKGDPARETSFR